MAICIGVSAFTTSADEYFLTLRSSELFADVPALSAMDGADRQSTLKSRRSAILSEQASVAEAASESGAIVHQKFSKLGNVIKVTATEEQLETLVAHPLVSRIDRVPSHEALTARSVPFVGAHEVWRRGRTTLTGRGVRIGIIDSGIDYNHANFGGSGDIDDYDNNDPETIEPGSFPTAKVVGGFDFAGDDYVGGAVGNPDPDPLDCWLNGHGTHVAGIAGGFGVLTNGTTFSGTYSTALDFSSFEIGPGVAPEAELYALKVFGCFGSTQLLLDALEWAADPNDDGDFSDRLDVVNISLGTSFGVFHPDEPEGRAIKNLTDLGCVVVVAAGNDGNTFYSIGFPAVVPETIAVAASIDDGIATRAIAIDAPESIAGTYEAAEGAFTEPLFLLDPFTAELVATEPADACDPLANTENFDGKIALIDRGTCFFEDKIRRAEQAGAIAAIVINNVDEPIITMGGNGGTVGIPGVMISLKDGATIRAALAEQVVATLDDTLIHERIDLADQIYEFSARGPAAPSNFAKPDIAAPGQSIVSASAGEGTFGTNLSGTSMAAPHVTGAAALLREAFPTLAARDIKQRLINTAMFTMATADGFPYAASRVGGGRLDVMEAVKTPVTVRAISDETGGIANLGLLDINVRETMTVSLEINNSSPTSMTFGVTVDDTKEDGFTITPEQDPLTIPARATAQLSLDVNLNPAALSQALSKDTPPSISDEPRHGILETEARVHLTHENFPMSILVQALARAASAHSLPSETIGIGNATEITVAMSGTTPHPAPLVSIFEAAPREAIPVSRIPTPNRIAAMGAASNFGSFGEDADLFFGLAMRANWTSPQPNLFSVTFEIDTDGNGDADFLLQNSTRGLLDADSLFDPSFTDDVHVGVLEHRRTSALLSTRLINALDPALHDTALMNNSMMVLVTPLADLNLPTTKDTIHYRLRVFFDDGLNGITLDPTDWVAFKPRSPSIDATFAGMNRTPFQPAASAPRIRIASVEQPPRALFLNHSGDLSRKHDFLSFRNDTDDVDADGINDILELRFFRSLDIANGFSDFDGDQLPDLEELVQGRDPSSTFHMIPVQIKRNQDSALLELQWTGNTEALFVIEEAEGVQNPWRPVSGLISGRPEGNHFAIQRTVGSPRFYRIRQLP